ncbi:hypothetical protein P8452_32528 [Trifolium repens]|nr:hypothetical protein P8452_32528 [Trifolium repens]
MFDGSFTEVRLVFIELVNDHEQKDSDDLCWFQACDASLVEVRLETLETSIWCCLVHKVQSLLFTKQLGWKHYMKNQIVIKMKIHARLWILKVSRV